MSQTKKHTNINLDLRTKNFKDIAKLSNTLNNKFRNIKVIFTQHNNILL